MSPDLKLLSKVVKETLLENVCSSHPDVSSPCECGEPLNKSANDREMRTDEGRHMGYGKEDPKD